MPIISTSSGGMNVDRYPDHCPICHTKILPTVLNGYVTGKHYVPGIRAICICPNNDCAEIFLAYYLKFHGNAYALRDCRPTEPVPLAFSDSMQEMSPSYCAISEEAHKAEEAGLTQICGVGYRKALEFLIKDYLIRKLPDDKETIEKVALATCIGNYIEDPRIKVLAKRATWLGNDETHYMRKWIDKDLSDLKLMIQAVVHWIEMEHYVDEALISMPEPEKPAKN